MASRRGGALMALLLLAAALWVSRVAADEHSHHYEDEEDVIVWVNTVGPYNNRQETYSFYQLPYCRGQEVVEHHHETLGEVLQGMELINAGIGMQFKKNVNNATLCYAILSESDMDKFAFAIRNNYWYQMYIDDLPVWGFVGYVDPGAAGEEGQTAAALATAPVWLYTHMDFSLSHNGDQIIHINLTSSHPVKIDPEQHVIARFSYSVRWTPTDHPFETRFERYLDHEFFEHKIHWFSIFNSFMMVIFLVGLVTLILIRTLNRDLARYEHRNHHNELERELADDYGWKLVHGDVFRAPPQLGLFAALVGTGWQLTVLTVVVLLITIATDLYTERSTILTASIFCYALTAVVAGYFSGSIYAQHDGKRWIRVFVLAATLWPSIASGVTLLNNFVAMYYSSSRAIHFGTLVAVIALWLLLVLPLTLAGNLVGRHWGGRADFPCRVNAVPRVVSPTPWYLDGVVLWVLSGVLPFGSIFIEMYFVFTSFWAYKIYYVYGFMLLVFGILAVVASCVTIVTVYLQLNMEDYRWHWTSFYVAGSTATYVYIYAFYYFMARTTMTGFFQIFFYFSYTAVVCFGIFVGLGAVGYTSASLFVRRIYRNIKID